MLNIAAWDGIIPPENAFLMVPSEQVGSIMSSTTRHGIPVGFMLRISYNQKKRQF